mmetsp:Transcript_115260/g.287911  ORF Transcript_115260/g.287911 Transcript_115260/m.287911 type:complete len:217 (+) Transcript_115260:653-1303(+)
MQRGMCKSPSRKKQRSSPAATRASSRPAIRCCASQAASSAKSTCREGSLACQVVSPRPFRCATASSWEPATSNSAASATSWTRQVMVRAASCTTIRPRRCVAGTRVSSSCWRLVAFASRLPAAATAAAKASPTSCRAWISCSARRAQTRSPSRWTASARPWQRSSPPFSSFISLRSMLCAFGSLIGTIPSLPWLWLECQGSSMCRCESRASARFRR